MFNEIISLFQGITVIPMIFIMVGLLLLIIEMFMPGFGVFGIIGSVFAVGAFIAQLFIGITFNQAVIIITFSVIVVIIALIVLYTLIKLKIVNTPLILTKTSVPENYDTTTREQRRLLGQIGFASSNFRPVGKFTIKNTIYDGITEGEYIEKDSKVKVIKVTASTIIVKKV